jgi:hypothetical protein
MGKSGVRLQMKLVCSNLAPFFIFLLQWMDFSCLLPRYFDFFHILIYKVVTAYIDIELCVCVCEMVDSLIVSLLSSWLVCFIGVFFVLYRYVLMGGGIDLGTEGKLRLGSFTVLYYHHLSDFISTLLTYRTKACGIRIQKPSPRSSMTLKVADT